MQGALRAEWIGFAAEMFAGVDNQGMEFVEELVLSGERGFEAGPEFFVSGFRMSEMVPFEYAAGIGVHDKNGMLARVKEDGVGGFRADAPQGQELFANSGGRCREKTTKRTAVFFVQEGYEGFESFALLAEVSGGAEVAGQLGWGDIADSGGGQQLGAAQVGDGVFDVFPRSVLREDGAYDNFEAGAPGPPVLGTDSSEERVIVRMQVVFRGEICA